MKKYPKRLRVMADYASSGIWVVKPVGPFRHAMIEYHALRLPEELARRFTNWINEYWKVLDLPEEFDLTAFNQQGRALARELKKHVGLETTVLFVPETKEGGPGPEEEIT
jgi:hypothetical protein